MTFIVGANANLKGSFVVDELNWRGNFACKSAANIFTFFQLSSLSMITFMAFTRLHVTIYPFKSPFKLISFTSKCLVCIFFSILVVSIGFTLFNIYVSESQLLPTALCNIFYNPLDNTINKIPALLLSVLQLGNCLAVIGMYYLILKTTRISLKMDTSKSKMLWHRRMMFQVILITGTNILCWVPSGIIYFSSVFIQPFPIKVLLFTSIYITPLNSIFNPIFITIVNKNK